jgi:glycosyltransferase involved in cell wall biosynthesis
VSSAQTSGPRRRLLFVLPFPPRLDGLHGGARVASQLIRLLAGRHEVAALYLRAPGEMGMDQELAAHCAMTCEVAIPDRPPLSVRVARRAAPLRGIPAWAAFVAFPELARKLRETAATWQPDVVHFEYHVMGQYAAALGAHAARRVLTEYEAGVIAVREHLAHPRDRGSLAARLQHRAWVRFERRVIAAMDAVVVFAERDRAALEPIAAGTPIVRIGLGTRLPPVPLDPLGSAQRPELLFVGSFTHAPNVDAALRLAGAIFPRVRERVPDATLRIIGPDAPPRLATLGGEGVEVMGRVPDVTPWLDAAALVVAPLRLGSGMRVKIVEALAHGKAIVTSARGIEGLALDDGVHVALAESDDQFAARIVELLGEPDRRRVLAANARRWACTHLGEERWADEYDALYERLLGSPDAEGGR